MHIGERLKRLMEDRKVAVKAMALHCGVTPGAVSNWFRTGRISKENLVAAAELLGTTADEIISGTEMDRGPDEAPRVPTQLDAALDALARAIAALPKLDRRQVAALLPLLAEEPESRADTTKAIMRLLAPSQAYEYTRTWEECAKDAAAIMGDTPMSVREFVARIDSDQARYVRMETVPTTRHRATR